MVDKKGSENNNNPEDKGRTNGVGVIDPEDPHTHHIPQQKVSRSNIIPKRISVNYAHDQSADHTEIPLAEQP
jgi:hypothetical protein